MNTLSSNPKKTMFYAAAQNMLNQHSNQSSVQTLQRSIFQLALVPPINQKEQLNQSLNNNSDRAQQNLSLPRNSNIFLKDRDRSLSYKLNNSIDQNTSLERLQNAYNIKGNFQITNENPSLIVEKEIKKQELKAYLLKQIQEKQIQNKQEQQRIKYEDLKAEELVKKQLEEIRKNLEFPRNSRKVPQPSISPNKDGIFMQIYKSKLNNTNQQNDILQKLSNIQNNINNLQQSQSKQSDVSSVRNNIKQMIRKSSQLLPQNNELIQIETKYQSNERQLDCETIFIPANSKLNTDIDTQQYQPSFQQQQEISKSTHNFIQNNSFQYPQQHNTSTISNPINNSQHYSSQNQNYISIVNHSRLTISQLTQRERSISNEKQNEELLAKVDEIKDEIKGIQQKAKKPVQANLQLKLPHRTTMLMQISSKNQIQVQKQEEPKSSQRN